MRLYLKRKLSSFKIICLGFALVILIGAVLLNLPVSANNPDEISFSDALFTSTSAVCVTGLVVHDTATTWTLFGQIVILCLIQIGGLGVMTLALGLFTVSGRKIGLMQRSTMQEAVAAHELRGVVRLSSFIIKTTFIIELLGAALLSCAFIPRFGLLKGIWYSIFHSISAFCNAGFDLMGVNSPYSSLTAFADDPVINICIMALIITGGIGFMTWLDIKEKKFHIKRYSMQSKTVLTVTAVLITVPALYFFFFEFGDMPLGERIWSSLFQSVTPRTAGFNTVDLTALSGVGIAVCIFLMVTGGSPGSTAGGMKTSTLAVLVASSVSVFRRREDAGLFGRRVSSDTIKNAAAIAIMYLLLFTVGGMCISIIEQLPLSTCLFECASAIGTVGLSLGITPELGGISRAILIFLMYFGRVGGLTLIYATLPADRFYASRLPLEKISVG